LETKEIKKNLLNFYNQEAAHRDSGVKQEWKIAQRDVFCEKIKEERKKTLLEIGAGTGHDSQFFMSRGLEVTAVDISAEMVRLCREKRVDAYEMDFYALSSLQRKFDCVWAMNCLLHVPKPDLPRVLENINGVLNEGGLFYMGVYGGEDAESNHVNEISETPRFFSFFLEQSLKNILKEVFDILSFDQIEVSDKFQFQSVIMRKRIR